MFGVFCLIFRLLVFDSYLNIIIIIIYKARSQEVPSAKYGPYRWEGLDAILGLFSPENYWMGLTVPFQMAEGS